MGTSSRAFQRLSPRERWLLEQMRFWAERAKARRDCKTEALIAWLRYIVKPDGKWSDERVILFTEYRATQNWLNEILVAEGLATDERLVTLYGGMDSQERERIKAAFQASPDQSPVRVLLATDAASEGIDLQNHCHRLVHLEIPWNPNRMEQRNGRIDRHGQRHEPLIYHFVAWGYQQGAMEAGVEPPSDLEADLEFLMRATEKVQQIREDLGKVGPVIAKQVEEAMLGKRTRLDTAIAEADAGAVRKMLQFERDLLRQIERYHDQLQETRQALQLTPENTRAVVDIALDLAGQLPLRPEDPTGFPSDACIRPVSSIEAYHLPPLRGSWIACTEGLAHPHTGEIRPIVFDHEMARGHDDVVLAHLNHRLVQMSLRLLRAEVWAPEGYKGLHRVTARFVPNHVLDTPAVIAHARLVVIGGDSHRLHEEIIAAGGTVRQGRFRRMNVGQVKDALQAAEDTPVAAATEQRLQDLWPSLRPALEMALEARVRDRTTGLERLLEERASKEMEDMEAVLGELAAAIVQELAEPEYRQLELWTSEERGQLTRNTAALRRRLDQIPNEIVAEKEAIRGRFAGPQPRMFPVAVTFLVPGRLDRE